jgi:hypothetical protein
MFLCDFCFFVIPGEVDRCSRVEHGSACAYTPFGENVFICDAALVHGDMKASQSDIDALHRYPLSCSVALLPNPLA